MSNSMSRFYDVTDATLVCLSQPTFTKPHRGRLAFSMSSFSESALEKKLSELSNSQQSVQTLSLWIIHHRKHSPLIVRVWHRELKKAKSSRKLTFLYLANDVIQNSKKKGPEFTKDFESVLIDACSHVARDGDEGCKKHMERLLKIWQERNLYRADFIQQLKLTIEDAESPTHKSTADDRKNLKRSFQKVQQQQQQQEEEEEEEDDDYRGHYSPRETDAAAPQLTEELVKALQDLENAASGDAAVRQKIASLPQEVQDVSLLEKITGEFRGRLKVRLRRMMNTTSAPGFTGTKRIYAPVNVLRPLKLSLGWMVASGNSPENTSLRLDMSEAETRGRSPELRDISSSSPCNPSDKDAADKLSKTVDEACLLLAEYNGRLAAELEDRKQLARMLSEYIQSQKDALGEREKKLEEYKQKLARVTQVRKELKSHIQSLPDLSLLPNVTGGLAPLPSAGDLFSTD
ncbi:hypothetical protein DNTS_005293 [Danionella cerebrum]|uniref:CID domain-containing protein n=1 Tax=Danionella cerebrum TaxID=2873325 RepID=A0A553R8V9_9TELE|nr:hypothetical protein DNTS_005293 [Danionella translucida]